MAKELSKLQISLFGNVSGLTKGLNSGIKSVTGFVGRISSAGGSLLKFTGIAGAVGAGITAIGSATKGFKLAAEFEQVQVSIETMLGSASAAEKVMGDLQKFAAETPFEFPELASSAKMLLAFGTQAEDIIPTMTTLGDVASGVGMAVTDLAEIYGKNMVQGRLQMEDINQLTGRGIPIIQELAKQFGVADSEVRGLVSGGQVTANHMKAAFESMAGEGGKFAGMMEKQSGTLGGLMSTLGDTVGFGLMRIAQTIIDAFNLKEGLKWLSASLEQVAGVMTRGVQIVAPVMNRVFTAIVGTFSRIYGAVAPVVTRVFAVVSNVFGQVHGVISTIGAAIWGTVVTVWDAVYGFIGGIVSSVAGFIATHWQSILVTTTGYLLSVWGVVSSVWGAISSMASGLWSGITAAWQWGTDLINNMTGSSGSLVSSVFGGIVSVGQWMQQALADVFNTITWAFNNWRDAVELVGVGAALTVVTFANQVTYYFTEVIPTTLGWLYDNWKNIFTTIADFTSAVFVNMYSNVKNFFTAVVSWFKGDGFNFEWTGLTEGFESSIKALPQIAEREIGAVEGILLARRDELAGGLGAFLADKRQEAEQTAETIASNITDAFNVSNAAIAMETPVIPTPEIPPVGIDAKINQDNLTVKVTPEIGKAGMIAAGSAEAQRARVMGSLMGSKTKPPVAAAGTETGLAGLTGMVRGGLDATMAGVQFAVDRASANPFDQPMPASANTTPGMRRTASDFTEKLLEQAKIQTARLESLIKNTIPLTTAEAL